ncbi:MAG: rhodanese-related sulfurtransferase [Xanthomonadales bacterium]|nr:rhodanese-related sulfurtransferase [Xanthomonadales bacterium]
MTKVRASQVEQARVQVAAFYKFVPLDDIEGLQQGLRKICKESDVLGTILLAHEGINGTIAGPADDLDNLFEFLDQYPGLENLSRKISYCNRNPFYRLKVRLKKEIVTLGVEGIDPGKAVGEYIAPEYWNALISQPDVRLIDTRNDYEVGLGTFNGAENPETQSFRDFPAWVEANLDIEKDQKVAMFCTGGIRCEKSTALLKELGYENVYHLEGGILNYLEKVPADESMWQGDCFVFDNRVTVDHDLAEGRYELCPACRMPLSEADRGSPKFEKNVSCPKCIDRLTPERRASLEERGRQIELAAARGEKHIGSR